MSVYQDKEEQALDDAILAVIKRHPGLERKLLDIHIRSYDTASLTTLTRMEHEVIVQLSIGRLTANKKIYMKPNLIPFTGGRVHAVETDVLGLNVLNCQRRMVIHANI